MVMTDPVADMLTRIRNAIRAKHDFVTVPASKIKGEILRLLKEEGYIEDYEVTDSEEFRNVKLFNVRLKYYGGRDKVSVITEIKRASRPGLRLYKKKDDIPMVNEGLGIAIISTSKGVMTDKQSRKYGIGGEVICYIS